MEFATKDHKDLVITTTTNCPIAASLQYSTTLTPYFFVLFRMSCGALRYFSVLFVIS